MDRVDLVEVFSSFQGEGPHVGRSTLFVRLAGCDLRCAWCDSPGTWLPARRCRIETATGAGEFREIASPVAFADLREALERLGAGEHRFVSITGGEPLLQPQAVAAIAGAVRALGGRVFLETHGLAVDAMAAVAEAVDVVSMDWKLASDVRRESDARGAPVEPFHAAHERFLRAARAASEVSVKAVVTPATADAEIDEMVARIVAVDPATPVVLQPVTPFASVRQAPSAERMLALLRRCEASLSDVRLIPQTHKAIGAP